MSKYNLDGLNELSKEIFKGNQDKGFWDNDLEKVRKGDVGTISTKLLLVVSEIVEAQDAIRKGGLEHPTDKPLKMTEHQEEIADAIIRLLDYSGAMEWNIEDLMKQKLEYNASRPYKHGKKF